MQLEGWKEEIPADNIFGR